MCGSWLNCRDPKVNELMRSQGIDDPAKQLDTFNAGVLAIHLGRWKKLKLTNKAEFWIRWNMDLPLYKLGSNPPLILSVRQNFQHLDGRWNCQRGHTCWDRGDAGALHWSGGAKPWTLAFARDRYDWLPSLSPARSFLRQIAAMPRPWICRGDEMRRRGYSAETRRGRDADMP